MLKTTQKAILLLMLSFATTAYASEALILGYWGNWHVWDADKNGRSQEEYQIPGSINKDTRSTVVNAHFQKQLNYLNAVAYAFLGVYPDVGMNSDLPQKTVKQSEIGTVYFTDPYSDLFNDDINAKFCRSNYTSCYFAYEISTHWNPNPKEVDPSQPWNYFYMGNFDAFTKLQKVKRIISIGGWYHEKSFEEGAFKNPDNFVKSIIAIINKAKQQGGYIDGVDFDYEPPTGYTAENAEKLVNLMQKLRLELDKNNLQNVMITAAVFAEKDKIEKFGKDNWKKMANVTNFIGMMDYDFHGMWDNPPVTGLQSNLFNDPNDPNKNNFSVVKALDALIAAGVPRSKLVLGIPSYGRVVGGVTSSVNDGLYQTFNPNLSVQEDLGNGQVSYYKMIGKWINQGYSDHSIVLDGKSIGVWAYNSANQQFVSYDNTAVVDTKAAYVLANKLGGMMMWELIGDVSPDDKNDASLLKHMHMGLNK